MVMLFDYNNLGTIYDILFSTDQQVMVAKMLIVHIAKNGGEIGKTEMSLFANKLHDGDIVVRTQGIGPLKEEIKVSYNKRQFYDRILTPMKSMGLIDYDLYKKTYKLSERYNQVLIKIGIMWKQELKKQLETYN